MAASKTTWSSKLSPYSSVRTTDDVPSEHDNHRTRRYGWKNGWLLESLSAIGSLLSLIAIIILLRTYDGRAIPRFPAGATLNGIVSVLSTTAKAMILTTIASSIGQYRWLRLIGSRHRKLQELQVFDEASRGPLGAFTLLWSTKIKSVAVLGCFCTIATLGFDPSVQQLIHTGQRTNYSNDPSANLLKTLVMTDPSHYDDGLSLAYRDSVVNALSDDAPSYAMTPSCQAKNCTWPVYDTLRFHSTCRNITDWIMARSENSNPCKTTCLYPTLADIEAAKTMDGCSSSTDYQVTCTYNLPSPFDTLSASWDSAHGNNYAGQPVLKSVVAIGIADTSSVAGSLLNASSMDIPIAMTATVRGINGYAEGYLCGLTFRLDTMNTSVQDGNTVTEVIGARSLSGVSLPSDSILRNTSFASNGYATTDAQLKLTSLSSLPANLTFSPLDSPSLSSFKNLTMGVDVWLALQQSFARYLSGNYTIDTTGVVGMSLHEPDAGEEILDGMSRTTNFTAMMDRIAASMTKQMRQSSNGAAVVPGQSGVEEIYITIQWAWLTLPLIVVISSILFFLIAVIETWRCGAEVWKTSCLPLLYNGHEVDLSHGQEPTTLKEMEKLADGTKVSLRRKPASSWILQTAASAQQLN